MSFNKGEANGAFISPTLSLREKKFMRTPKESIKLFLTPDKKSLVSETVMSTLCQSKKNIS